MPIAFPLHMIKNSKFGVEKIHIKSNRKKVGIKIIEQELKNELCISNLLESLFQHI